MHNLDRLLDLARPFYDNGDPAHDFVHILRVLKSCRTIGEAVGADLHVLCPAAILHDIVNLPKDHPDRSKASTLAAEKAVPLLEACSYDPVSIDRIQGAIRDHSFSRGAKPSTLEAAVLQDADRLDTLGTIGLFRTVTVGALMGASYYNADDPYATARPLDDTRYTLDHFTTKLFKLPDLMNTEPGRTEALRRVAFMRQALDQLASEL